jgi:hypothetical protein
VQAIRQAHETGWPPIHFISGSYANKDRPIKDGYMAEFRDTQFIVLSDLLRGS